MGTAQKYSKHVASKSCFVYLTYSSITEVLDTQEFVHNISKCSPNYSNQIIQTNYFILNNIYYKNIIIVLNCTGLIYATAVTLT